MSKTIKVEDQVYNYLEELRDKRETFSQVVERLVDIRRMLVGLEPILRGQKAYHDFKERQEAVKAAVDG